MNIQNTQQAYKQPSLETMVGNQKQEYPKPSIPPENGSDGFVSIPETPESDYSARENQGSAQLEAHQANKEQDAKEAEMNETPSLNSMQTLALQANTTQNKIDAYKAGAGIDSDTDKSYLNLSNTQDRMDAQKELQTIQETMKKQQGHQTYATQMGML